MILFALLATSTYLCITHASSPPTCAHVRAPWIFATDRTSHETYQIGFSDHELVSPPGVIQEVDPCYECKTTSQQISSNFILTTNVGVETTFVLYNTIEGKSVGVTYGSENIDDGDLPGIYFVHDNNIIGCHGRNCYKFDAPTKQFKKMDATLSTQRNGASVVVLDGQPCMFGGISSTPNIGVECLAADGTWKQNETLPSGDGTFVSTIMHNNALYICGGDRSCSVYPLPIDKQKVTHIKGLWEDYQQLAAKPILFSHNDKLFMIGTFTFHGSSEQWNLDSDDLGKPFLLNILDRSTESISGPFCKDGLFVIQPCESFHELKLTKSIDYGDAVADINETICELIQEPWYYAVNLKDNLIENIQFPLIRKANLPGVSGRHNGIHTTATSLGKYVVTDVHHVNDGRVTIIIHDMESGQHVPMDVTGQASGNHFTCGDKFMTLKNNTLYNVDPTMLTYKTLPGPTVGRIQPAIVHIDEKVCLIGGSSSESLAMECLKSCETQSPTWESLEGPNVKGTDLTAVIFGEELVVCGGKSSDPYNYYCDRYRRNPDGVFEAQDTSRRMFNPRLSDATFVLHDTVPNIYVHNDVMHIVGQAIMTDTVIVENWIPKQVVFMIRVPIDWSVQEPKILLVNESSFDMSIVMPCPRGPPEPGTDLKLTVFDQKDTYIVEAIDTTINPCTDFYEFACGSYINDAQFLPSKPYWSVAMEMQFKIYDTLKTDLSIDIAVDESKLIKTAKYYYQSCVKGGDPMSLSRRLESSKWPMLDLYDRSTDSTNAMFSAQLISVAKKFTQLPLYALLRFAISQHSDDPLRKILTIDLPVTLMTKDDYLDKRSDVIIASIKSVCMDIVKLLSELSDKFNVPQDLAAQVDNLLQFETRIAGVMPTEVEKIGAIPVEITLIEIERLFPKMRIKDLLIEVLGISEEYLLDTRVVRVNNITALRMFAEIVNETDNEGLLNFMVMLSVVGTGLTDLGQKFNDLKIRFDEAYGGMTLTPEDGHNSDKCIYWLTNHLPEALDVILFAQNENYNAMKMKMEEMLTHIRTNMIELISDAQSWMDQETRNQAIAKVNNLTFKVGLPNDLDYKFTLPTIFDGQSLYDVSRMVQKARAQYAATLLHDRRNRNDFPDRREIHAFVMYDQRLNSIVVSPMALMEPMLDSTTSNSINYGAIGFIAARSFFSAISRAGKNYDWEGKMVKGGWWSDPSKNSFNSRSECFIEQYNQLQSNGVQVNGTLSVALNMKDNFGLHLAYKTFQKETTHKDEDEKHNNDLMFFLSFGRHMCEIVRMSGPYSRDPAAIENKFRVNGVVQNMNAFATTFKCGDDDTMKSPNQCSIV